MFVEMQNPCLEHCTTITWTCHIQKLKDDGKVWCIFNAERKEEVFFPRDSKPQVAISQDLVDFWHNIKVSETGQRVCV